MLALTRQILHVPLAALPIVWACVAWPPRELDPTRLGAGYAFLPVLVVVAVVANRGLLSRRASARAALGMVALGLGLAVAHGFLWVSCRVYDGFGMNTFLPAWNTTAIEAVLKKYAVAYKLPEAPSREQMIAEQMGNLTYLQDAAVRDPGAILVSLALYGATGLSAAVFLGAGLVQFLWIGRVRPVSRGAEVESKATYDAFVSYNSTDRAAVEHLVDRLEQRGLRLWIDTRHILGGTLIAGLVDEGMLESTSALVLQGATGLGPWQRIEIGAWIGRVARGRGRIVPILLPHAAPMEGLLSAYRFIEVSSPPTDDDLHEIEEAVRGAIAPQAPRSS